MRVQTVANLVGVNSDVYGASHQDVVSAGPGRLVTGDEDQMPDKGPHPNGQTPEEIEDLDFAERRVLVAAKGPCLGTVVIVNVEGDDVGSRESGALNQSFAVLGIQPAPQSSHVECVGARLSNRP